MNQFFRNISFLLIFFFHLSGAINSNAQDVVYSPKSVAAVQKIPLLKESKKAFISFYDTPLSVLVFLSPDCPLCKNYSLVLNELQQDFRSKINIYGVVPGSTYTNEEVKKYIKDYKIIFPVMVDPKKQFTSMVEATVTPEVVLVNQDGAIVYRGAIDDWVEELGRKKIKPEQHFLKEAINQYLQNKPVAIKKTVAKGCWINEF
jgi:thiol-disulfide isomerase/thioredoxin